MLGLKPEVPVTDEVEARTDALVAIDCGITEADEGRTVPIRGSAKTNSRVDFQIRVAEAVLADPAAAGDRSECALGSSFAYVGNYDG